MGKKKRKKKAAEAEKALRELLERLRGEATESVRAVWLAGLGALDAVDRESGPLFEAWLARGRKLESRTRTELDGLLERGERWVEEMRGRVAAGRGGVETRVTAAFERLGVPTRRDLEALRQRIGELEEEIARRREAAPAPRDPAGARAAPGSPAEKRTARKAAKKEPAARKVSAKGPEKKKPEPTAAKPASARKKAAVGKKTAAPKKRTPSVKKASAASSPPAPPGEREAPAPAAGVAAAASPPAALPAWAVEPAGAEWIVRRAGRDAEESRHPTKKPAVDEARDKARAAAGRLVIHRQDGSVQAEHTYD